MNYGIIENMVKLKTFLQTFVKSCTSPAYYADILKAKFSFSLKYFILFNFLISLITVVKILIPLFAMDFTSMTIDAINIFPADLAISIQNGKLSVNQPLPYVIPFPTDPKTAENKDDLSNFIVFESDKNIKGAASFFDYHSVFVITETTVYSRRDASSQEIRSFPIPESMGSVIINRQQLENLRTSFLNLPIIKTKSYVAILGILAFLFLVPLMIWARFYTALIYAILVYFLTMFLRGPVLNGQKIPFKKMLQLSLHSLTPVIVLAYVASFLGNNFQFWGWSYFLVYLVWTIIVVHAATAPSKSRSK